MAVISGKIDNVIEYLQRMKDKGYKTVEIVDYYRTQGWELMGIPNLTFVVNEEYPTVLGIDMMEYVKKR